MADAAVAPIEQDEPALISDHVAGMEVPMHERLRQRCPNDAGQAEG